MEWKNHEEFFNNFSDNHIKITSWVDWSISVEEMYQHFKARMENERKEKLYKEITETVMCPKCGWRGSFDEMSAKCIDELTGCLVYLRRCPKCDEAILQEYKPIKRGE
jgi:predicted RNA-binding Zn-ribbon protein involved in translation (DUF1610 family)